MDQSEFFCLHSDLCKTLANAKRQMILNALREGESTVTEIQERTSIPQATLSQHLAILRSAGVVRTRREGNHIFYVITNPKIIQAFDLITEVMQEIIGDRKHVAEGANEG
ncbi:MAG: ArsR/SmtB family transcription factor [Coriobacteriia bacterium]